MANNSSSGGIGFFGALGILFIGLKLTNVIDWDWWVVLSPIWGSILVAIVIVVGAICAGINEDRKWGR